jgi:hypothetical protein
MDNEPVDPELEVPELNVSKPDTPAVPAFADNNCSMPLDVAVPSPEARRT